MISDGQELLDTVDEAGRIIGRETRERCHGDPSLIHRSVHVFVFNSDGELYLQKRSMNKDVQPGKWDTSVGGHLDLGEEYDDAAQREMEEELGITGIEPQYLYAYLYRNPRESEAIRMYRIVYDDPIVPDPDEISEGRFWSLGEIEGRLGQGIFTPNFESEIRRYKKLFKRFIP